MSFRVATIVLTILFAFVGVIALSFYGGIEIDNQKFTETTCNIANYTFAPNGNGYYSSWIDISTTEGSRLTYWFHPLIYDPARMIHYYSIHYPLGMTQTCFISETTWIWYLPNSDAAKVFFIISFSLAGICLVASIIHCIIYGRKPNTPPIVIGNNIELAKNDLV